MKFESVTTERLVVREFAPGDSAGLMDFVNDQDALGMMMFSMKDEAELESFLSIAMAGESDPNRVEYHCAIASREDPSVCIGCVSLMGSAENPAEMEIGYFIQRRHWGKGYTLEASRAMLAFAFGPLGLHRVWGKCHERNHGSARVMEKLGMTFEGTIREHVWLRDHWRSSREYGILDREWK